MSSWREQVRWRYCGTWRGTHHTSGERRVETVGLSPTEMRLTNLKARLGSGLDDRMG
jgi:hypothetical protein